MPGLRALSRSLRATLEAATSIWASPFSMAPWLSASTLFLATVSSAASLCKVPISPFSRTGMPIFSSTLSITPSRRAATSDFSIQSIVASSSRTSVGALPGGLILAILSERGHGKCCQQPHGEGCHGFCGGHGRASLHASRSELVFSRFRPAAGGLSIARCVLGIRRRGLRPPIFCTGLRPRIV